MSELSANVPKYLSDRIRQPPPEGCGVIVGTTPVVSFGNASKARVATLSINPSSKEFLGGSQLLSGTKRRLATLESIKATGLDELSDSQVASVLEDCNNYFKKNPYMAWFGKLETMLQQIGLSYLNDSACHLDLVQDATLPAWRGLQPDVKSRLIEKDVPFLQDQIRQENIQTIIVNGRTVWETLKEFKIVNFEEVSRSHYGNSKTTITYFSGTGWGCRFLGWTANLQQMQASNEARAEAHGQISEWLHANFL